MVGVCVQVTPALEKLSGCCWNQHSKGFPWLSCWLLWACPNLCLEIPEALVVVPYLQFHQEQKIQSPGFSSVSWFGFFFCEQNSTQFTQYWCKHQPQIISACGQLIILLAPGGRMPRHFCNSESITFTLYLYWMFKYFCILVTVSSTSSCKCYTCFGWS